MVLLSSFPIRNPNMLLLNNFDGTILLSEDIDSSLIKTCRLLYEETSPILYQNQFVFDDSYAVAGFTEKRLKRMTSLRLVIGEEIGQYYDRLPTLAQQAQRWCGKFSGVFQNKDELNICFPRSTASRFENLKAVELNFSH